MLVAGDDGGFGEIGAPGLGIAAVVGEEVGDVTLGASRAPMSTTTPLTTSVNRCGTMLRETRSAAILADQLVAVRTLSGSTICAQDQKHDGAEQRVQSDGPEQSSGPSR